VDRFGVDDQLLGAAEGHVQADKAEAAPGEVELAGTAAHRNGGPMTAAVVGGALATGAPSAEAVLSEHTPVQPGGHACRACGHVYSDELPVCPAVVAAQAGYPGVADRMRLDQVDDQVTALEALQVGQERIEARIDALAEAVDDQAEQPVPLGALCQDCMGWFGAAVMWSLITLVAWRAVPHLHLAGWSYVGGVLVVSILATEALDQWVAAAQKLIDGCGRYRQLRRTAKASVSR
jgi:hypothetical protein